MTLNWHDATLSPMICPYMIAVAYTGSN